MALVDLTHPIMYPFGGFQFYGVSEANLSSVGDRIGHVGKFPKAGTVVAILYGVGSVGGAGTVDASRETVDATTGMPTGTAKNDGGGNAVATAIAYASNDDNRVLRCLLDTDYTCTMGEEVAVVIEQNTATTFNACGSSIGAGYESYCVQYAGSWVDGNRGAAITFEYSDGSFAPMLGGQCALPQPSQSGNVTTATNPDEVGVRFQVPFSMSACGFVGWGENDQDDSLAWKLYDSDDSTVLETVTTDTDKRTNTGLVRIQVGFTQNHTLAIDTWYRLTMTPSVSSGSNQRLGYWNADTAAQRDALVPNWRWCQRENAGTWDDSASDTLVPRLGLLVSQLDNGAGGAGGGNKVHGGAMGVF